MNVDWVAVAIAFFALAIPGLLFFGRLMERVDRHGESILEIGKNISALHARVDALVLALAQHGVVAAEAVAHLARRAGEDRVVERVRGG